MKTFEHWWYIRSLKNTGYKTQSYSKHSLEYSWDKHSVEIKKIEAPEYAMHPDDNRKFITFKNDRLDGLMPRDMGREMSKYDLSHSESIDKIYGVNSVHRPAHDVTCYLEMFPRDVAKEQFQNMQKKSPR